MDNQSNISTKYASSSHVSRETINDLIIYERLLLDNNKKLNLIAKSTEKDIWNRHFLDSIQVIDFIDKDVKTCVDLGSGAGLPGMALSIVAKERKLMTKFGFIRKKF